MNLFLDIDRTISDADWREPLISAGGWDDYHNQAHRDKPITEIIELVRALASTGEWTIIGLTARPEKVRQMTMRWLVSHRVLLDELLMRADDNFSPSARVKIDLVHQRCGGKEPNKSRFIIMDDREDVCVAFRDLGYVALQVHRRPNHGG